MDLPAVSDAALPRDVRAPASLRSSPGASPCLSDAEKKAYKAALGFEKLLLGQLVKEMTAATPSLTEGARGDAVTEAMTDALAHAGGIGLAPQLFKTLQRTAP
jgi:Rod binding domain-containing protein